MTKPPVERASESVHGGGEEAGGLPLARRRQRRRANARRRGWQWQDAGPAGNKGKARSTGAAGPGVLHGGAGGAVPLPHRAAGVPAARAAPAAAAAVSSAARAGGPHGRTAGSGGARAVRRPGRHRRRRVVVRVLKHGRRVARARALDTRRVCTVRMWAFNIFFLSLFLLT